METNTLEYEITKCNLYRYLSDDLTEAFAQYQYRLENPMPTKEEIELSPNISQPIWIHKYQTDNLFHNRVQNLTAGVMQIIEKTVKKASK